MRALVPRRRVARSCPSCRTPSRGSPAAGRPDRRDEGERQQRRAPSNLMRDTVTPPAAARTPRSAGPAAARRARRTLAARRRTPACPPAVSIRTGSNAEPGQVVRRRPHVELADVPRQLEAVGHQVRADHRRQPEGVLVEVHARRAGSPAARTSAGRRGRARACCAAAASSVKKRNASKWEHAIRCDSTTVSVPARAEPQRLRVPGLVAPRAGRPSPTRAARSSRCAPAARRSPTAAGGSPRAAAAARRRTPR